MSKTVKMKHDSITSFSHDGQQFDAVKGVFDMTPEAAAVAAQEFSFTVAEPAKKAAKDDGQGAGE
jgi:hypothetical protein